MGSFFTTSITRQVPKSSIWQLKVGLANSSIEDASQPLPTLEECCLCQVLNPLTSILQLTSCDLETKPNLNYPRRKVYGLSLQQLQGFTTQQESRINTRAWQWQKVALRLDISTINLLDFAYSVTSERLRTNHVICITQPQGFTGTRFRGENK